MNQPSFGLFAPRQPQLRDPKGAVEMLRRSIELDPDNLAAYLTLCAVYQALKQTSERNRLLDRMTARFPDDKKVLLHAGQGCIERKALVKGLDYLARARQLDQLDGKFRRSSSPPNGGWPGNISSSTARRKLGRSWP